MPLTMGSKAATFGSTFLGATVAPVLAQTVDAPAAENDVKNNRFKSPESKPLLETTSIVVPLLTGIATALIAIFGPDRWWENREALQMGLLGYGAAATGGGLVELGRRTAARSAVGMSAFNPTQDQDLAASTDFCPVRSIAYYRQPKKAADAPCGCGVAADGGGAVAGAGGGVIA